MKNESINELLAKRRSTKMSELFRKMFLNALKTHSKEQYLRSHYLDSKNIIIMSFNHL